MRDLRRRALAAGVPGVRCPHRLDQQHVDFLFGIRPVLDAARHDEELAWPELDPAIAQLNGQPSSEDEEEIVGIGVRVPDELALCLDDLTARSR